MQGLMFRCWFLLGIFWQASIASADPISYHNEYKTRYYGFSIKVNSSFESLGEDRYKATFIADSAIATIHEQSEMRWDASSRRFYPLHYTYSKKVLGKEKKSELLFDWQNHRVKDMVRLISLDLPEDVLIEDELSYQLQMREDILEGQTQFSYWIVDGGKLKEYPFNKLADEQIKTPLGTVDTVKISRSHGKSERKTFAWLARDWNYLLVGLEHQEKGSSYRLLINKARLDGTEIANFEK